MAAPSGRRKFRAIGSAQSFERRVYNETAKRVAWKELFRRGKPQFSTEAAGTYGGSKAEKNFFGKAETSCNAEAEKAFKAEPRAVGTSGMMVFTRTPKAHRRFEPNRHRFCAARNERLKAA